MDSHSQPHAAGAETQNPPNAVFPPFKRGRTGLKGCTKYIQLGTGSWVTFNADGSCHIGARHRYIGNIVEVAGELEQRKEYAEAWRINMQRAERERDALKASHADAIEALESLVDAVSKPSSIVHGERVVDALIKARCVLLARQKEL